MQLYQLDICFRECLPKKKPNLTRKGGLRNAVISVILDTCLKINYCLG